ncbi:cell division protein FtsQ/DivIB [Streptococcus merionis]|uniref:Cell division protein DivIB n=1 Tax=Streptococcus merionis TaxID=400065 RepID=A0A239SME8_9STRE|nr:FtsQ-type POTRA domain-containing protein [Streptococcus merionis]SNU86028.1 putative cell division protein [Streptococcus merionis]
MSEKETPKELLEEAEQETSKAIDLVEWLRKNNAYLERRAKEKAIRQETIQLISDDNQDISDAEQRDSESTELAGLEEEEIVHLANDNLENAETSEPEGANIPESEADKETLEQALEVNEDLTSEEELPEEDMENASDVEESSESEEEEEKESNEEDSQAPEEGAEESTEETQTVLPESESYLSELTDNSSKRPRARLSVSHKHLIRLITLFFVTLTTILVTGYLVSPWSKLKNVTVEGQGQVSAEDVLANTGIRKADYTLTTFLNQNQIAKTLEKQLVWVKDAQVSYQFPIDFKITVEEHQVVGYVKDGTVYYPVLSSGVTLDTAVAVENLPDPYLLFDMTDLSQVKAFVANLSQLGAASPLSRIVTVKAAPTTASADLLALETVEGHTVYVPLSEVAEKMAYYEKVVRNLSVPSYIDMEAGIFTYAK